MGEIDNQQDRDYRGELIERVRAKYPDRSFSVQSGESGESIEQAVMEMLDEGASALDEMNSKNAQIAQLFVNDPQSGNFIMEWMATGDPRAALVKTFGDGLSSLGTEEGRAAFGEQLSDWRRRKAESDAAQEEAERNWEASKAALESFCQQNGLSIDQGLEILFRLQKIAADALMNKYDPADFSLVLKEMNYDGAIEAARNEGLVAGRNETIERRRRGRGASDVIPPAISGRGIRATEPKPKSPESPWAGVK